MPPNSAPLAAGRNMAKRPKIAQAFGLAKVPTLLLSVQKASPLEALELLRRNLPRDQEGLATWRSNARVAAVLGSCPRSLQSFTSGKQCCKHGGRAWLPMAHRTQALGKLH